MSVIAPARAVMEADPRHRTVGFGIMQFVIAHFADIYADKRRHERKQQQRDAEPQKRRFALPPAFLFGFFGAQPCRLFLMLLLFFGLNVFFLLAHSMIFFNLREISPSATANNRASPETTIYPAAPRTRLNSAPPSGSPTRKSSVNAAPMTAIGR